MYREEVRVHAIEKEGVEDLEDNVHGAGGLSSCSAPIGNVAQLDPCPVRANASRS